MASTSEASPSFTSGKPVIVRVKRKPSQSPLEAFWVEINERPTKRPLLDFEKLSINDSSGDGNRVEEVKSKKVLVQHVETRRDSDSVDLLELFASNSAGGIGDESKTEERKRMFKKENKQEQLSSKARERQVELSKNARFEQIWRKRRGNEEALQDKALKEMCQFYDVVRVDGAERSKEVQQDVTTIEDQQLLRSYLPLLKEFIPSAASELESEMLSHFSERDEYVYDYYTVKDDMDIGVETASSPFPLVQVEDEEYCDGEDDDSEYDTADSNDESHPQNEYPDELTEEEEEAESDTSIDEPGEVESDDGSNRSSETEDLKPGFSRDACAAFDNEIYDYLETADFYYDEDGDADEDSK